MSSKGPVGVTDLAAQRRKKALADTSANMLDATVEVLRELRFDQLSVTVVARRADVPVAVAADLFGSTNDLIVELCLRRIDGIAVDAGANCGSITRVAAQLSEMMLVIAEEPAIASACAAVFLDSGPAAHRAHEQIGLQIHRLIASAVGAGSWPEVITTLELVFSGALIQAAAGTMSFQQAADRMQTAVSLILEGAPSR